MCYTCLEHLGRAWRDLWATSHESGPACTLTGRKYIHMNRFVVNMEPKTYNQRVAKYLDRLYSKHELIWKYIELANKYDKLVQEKRGGLQ